VTGVCLYTMGSVHIFAHQQDIVVVIKDYIMVQIVVDVELEKANGLEQLHFVQHTVLKDGNILQLVGEEMGNVAGQDTSNIVGNHFMRLEQDTNVQDTMGKI